jgi:hypothetical protein
MIGLGQTDVAPRCSRAGCTSPAEWNVNWRNPKLHTPDRVKVWLACTEHRDSLRDFLDARDFPVVITPFGESLDRLPEPRNAGAL